MSIRLASVALTLLSLGLTACSAGEDETVNVEGTPGTTAQPAGAGSGMTTPPYGDTVAVPIAPTGGAAGGTMSPDSLVEPPP